MTYLNSMSCGNFFFDKKIPSNPSRFGGGFSDKLLKICPNGSQNNLISWEHFINILDFLKCFKRSLFSNFSSSKNPSNTCKNPNEEFIFAVVYVRAVLDMELRLECDCWQLLRLPVGPTKCAWLSRK